MTENTIEQRVIFRSFEKSTLIPPAT